VIADHAANKRIQLRDGLTLYFARHGQTQANLQKRFSGDKDTPLTELGQAQARNVGLILKRELGDAAGINFVCSPLARAQTTMRIARQTMGLAPNGFATDERLKEINLGTWDQLTDDEARALDPGYFDRRMNDKWNVRVPEGENYADVAARARGWVSALKADTFAVSHGAFTRILRGLVLGLDAPAMSGLDEPQGVVFRVTCSQVALLDR
jgi:broad specificity phosphatase PhoE